MKNIRHLGLVVKDMNKALIFYRDLLGLKIQGITEEKGFFINQILSKDNVILKTIKLSANDNNTRIELIQYISNESIFNKKNKLDNHGFTHIALTVEDLDNLFFKLKKEGVFFTCNPLLSPNKKLKVTFCKDFEGNYLELIQEL